MNGWIRLLLPIGLGVTAAVMNMTIMARRLSPVTYVGIRDNLETGERIEAYHLFPVQLSGQTDASDPIFIRWEDRHILVGVTARQELEGGAVITRRVLRTSAAEVPEDKVAFHVSISGTPNVPRNIVPGELLQFYVARQTSEETDYLGPFEVHAVGERISDDPSSPSQGNEQVLTLLSDVDPGTARLPADAEALIEAGSRVRGSKIVGVILMSSASRRPPATNLAGL